MTAYTVGSAIAKASFGIKLAEDEQVLIGPAGGAMPRAEKKASATNIRSLINAVPAAVVNNPVAASALAGGTVGALGAGGAAALDSDPEASALRSALAGGALGAGMGALGGYAGPRVVDYLKAMANRQRVG